MNPLTNIRRDGSEVSLFNMIRILTRRTSGLNICHFNAQSLNNKMDEFRFIFENSRMDIICVSETWFNAHIQDNIYKLEGYRMYRSDRKSHGGGVAIYVRSTICLQFQCKILVRHGDIPNIEHLFIELHIDNQKLLLGTIYRPHRSIDIDPLLNYLSSLTLEYTDIVLAGDFNSNIITDKSLMQNMSAVGLFLINETMPTHFTSTASTLLDLYFVGNRNKVLLYEQLSASLFSRHDLIYLSYNFKMKAKEQKINYRDFKNINMSSLEAELLSLPWDNIFCMPAVDEQATFLHNNIQYLYEKYVITKTKTITPMNKPWFTHEIIHLINERNRAYNRWKRYRTVELENCYKMCRRRVNLKIRFEKYKHYENKFKSAVSSERKWKEIRNMGVVCKNNEVDKIIDVNQLNYEFTNIPKLAANIDFYDTVNEQTMGFECLP